MHETCHRCSGDLPAGSGETPFCPHCGAPQLFLALENQSAATTTGEGGTPVTTGTPAPPRVRQVEWKTAIRCAAVVAAVGAVLSVAAMPEWKMSPLLSSLSFLWIMSASLITTAFYQKRRPAAWMDVGIGARIGVVVGICLALGLAVGMAGAGLLARFVLHSMGNFDAQLAVQVVQAQKAIQQKAVEQSTQMPAGALGFMQTPEFRAGIVLGSFALMSGGMLVVSALGGAFAGLLRMRRGTAV